MCGSVAVTSAVFVSVSVNYTAEARDGTLVLASGPPVSVSSSLWIDRQTDRQREREREREQTVPVNSP